MLDNSSAVSKTVTDSCLSIDLRFQDFKLPRQLRYQWGSKPSISWDWWIDPDSSTYHLRKELKYISGPYFYHLHEHLSGPYIFHLKPRIDESRSWEATWPLTYPAWFRFDDGFDDIEAITQWRQLGGLAQSRANRRWEKKAEKAARAQGLKRRDRMPGAWPV